MEDEIIDIEVIFRICKGGDVVALFPYSIYSNDHIGLINSYMHIGQHSSSSYCDTMQSSKPAKEDGYKDLKEELESIGYNLKIIKRRHFQKYLDAWHKVRETA